MSNDGQFHGKRLVSRESSTASDVIDLVNDADDSDGDVAAAAFAKSTKPHQKSMNNGMRFRGERQSSQLLTSSESDDVIDLVNDGEDEATKRRQAPTQPSSSSAKRKSEIKL